MNEKTDGGEKWVECWDCGEAVRADSCQGLPCEVILFWPDGSETTEERYYPACDLCYRTWVSILEATK